MADRVVNAGSLKYFPKKILDYGSPGTIIIEGQFGDKEIAVKRIMKECREKFNREKCLLQIFNHENIIKIFNILLNFEDEGVKYQIMK